jgi:methionine sulfoxide reductase catalytic subunit
MLIRFNHHGFNDLKPSEITSRAAYANRRKIIKSLAAGIGGSVLTQWGMREAIAQSVATRPGKLAALPGARSVVSGALSMDKLTSYADVTSYNNFYEFGTDKEDPAQYAQTLRTKPWTLEVEGLIKRATKFAIDDLLKMSAQEERIYRLRCVEGWSMVIPWIGYSLSELIRKVEPLGSAKFVEFISMADSKMMPGLSSSVLQWPYVEGLRMDEAMHPLTILSFGLYGEVMPNQNGAPVRLVVPWKYGFKSGKSLVKIRFTDRQPATSWNKASPQEYGFYSNVNPEVDHPRWSQASERRIGEDGLLAKKRKTLMFNGYEAQVGQLYTGMDLKKFF